MRAPRLLALSLLTIAVVGGAAAAFGAEPSELTLLPDAAAAAWAGQTFTDAETPSPDVCAAATDPPEDALCDHVSLTVDVRARFWEAHDGGVSVSVGWSTPADDFDLYVYDAAGALVASSAMRSLRTPAESVFLPEPVGTFEVRVVPVSVQEAASWGTATLTFEEAEPSPSPSPPPFPTASPSPKPKHDHGDGSGGGGSSGYDYDYRYPPSGSSGARSFDSSSLPSPEASTPTMGPTMSPSYPTATLAPSPSPTTIASNPARESAPPRLPRSALLVVGVAVLALGLTGFAVFDRVPRPETPAATGADGSEPERPSA